MLIKVKPSWYLPYSAATPKQTYLSRRQLLKAMAVGVGAAASGCYLSVEGTPPGESTENAGAGCDGYQPGAHHNPKYSVPERCLTASGLAYNINNFYEFSVNKSEVAALTTGWGQSSSWNVEVSGLVNRPRTFSVAELRQLFQPEERVYRFRCVEAWAMTVPWLGFQFSRLAELVEPQTSATHVELITAWDPERMPGVERLPLHPWPYHEGLRLDEAMNELTFLATGMYGENLYGQNGAPLRLVVPWKYGYKSIKSIVRIRFVDSQPQTFWNDTWPEAYDFQSNVDPSKSHPSWAQSHERVLGTADVVETMKYNGYGDLVGHLY